MGKVWAYKGFTLIELMIVVVIIGIISAVAIPSYNSYVYESRRSDAYIAVTSAAAEQERIYTYDNQYTTDISRLGGARSPEGYYTISVQATDTTYIITATAVSGQSQFRDTDCRALLLTHLGVKTSTNSLGQPSSNCWKK